MNPENDTNNKYAVLSCSGGMDSTSLLIHLLADGYKVQIINFDYGSHQNGWERSRLDEVVSYLTAEKHLPVFYENFDLSDIMGRFYSSLTDSGLQTPDGNYADENMKITVVPNRNAIFASLIYGVALSVAKRNNVDVKIAMGVHNGDHTIYPDCTPEFFDQLYKAFAAGNWDAEKVQLYLPYLNGDKGDIVIDCHKCCEQLGLDFDYIMSRTLTCYKPNADGESCGTCGSCTERIEAFAKAGLKDPVNYVKPEGVVHGTEGNPD